MNVMIGAKDKKNHTTAMLPAIILGLDEKNCRNRKKHHRVQEDESLVSSLGTDDHEKGALRVDESDEEGKKMRKRKRKAAR